MKKYILLLTLICLAFCGCSRQPQSVNFYNITGAMSNDVTIDIKFTEEQEYKDTYADVLIKPSEQNQVLSVKREYSDFCEITMPKIDTWYSLTVLMNRANGKEQDEYQKYQDIVEWVLILNSAKDSKFSLKAVNGQLETAANGGSLLVNWKNISKEYTFDISAKA